MYLRVRNVIARPNTNYRMFCSIRKKVSDKYWDNEENVKEFLSCLKEKLNLNSQEDWNLLTSKQIQNSGGSAILNKYSLSFLKKLGFPETQTKNYFIHNAPKKPLEYWKNIENVKIYLDYLKEKFQLNSFDDWNSITREQILAHGGRGLFRLYSLYEIKCMGFPEGKELFLHESCKKYSGYWKNEDNVQKFLIKLKEKLNLQTIDDWNSITRKDIHNLGGGSLLNMYPISKIKLLGCPNLDPNLVKTHKPNRYWDDTNNIIEFLKELKVKFNLKSIDDWHRLSTRQIQIHGGGSLLSKYSKLEILNKVIQTNKSYHGSVSNNLSGRSSQRWLFLQIQKLFPGEEIVEDYYHEELTRKSGFPIQFDVFLVQKKIAFEYHGIQHYEDTPYFAGLEMYQFRDNEKSTLCNNFGIQLIIIPHTWDNKLDSLRKIVEEFLPPDREYKNPSEILQNKA